MECEHKHEHPHCQDRCPWMICDRCGQARAVGDTTLHGHPRADAAPQPETAKH